MLKNVKLYVCLEYWSRLKNIVAKRQPEIYKRKIYESTAEIFDTKYSYCD